MRILLIIRTAVVGFVLILAAKPTQSQNCDDNYVRTTVMLDSTGTSANVSVTYYDGLGRPVGTTEDTPQSGTYTHAAMTYDALGRVTRETLPYAFTSPSPSLPPSSSMLTALPGQYGGDSRPWTDRAYDALDREAAVTGPGQAWATHPTSVAHGTNTAGEVARFTCSGDAVVRQGSYPIRSLAKETLTDEDGRAVTVFTDLRGLTVLERRPYGDTYFVYDSRGLLRFVLPPAASAAMSSNGTWDVASPEVDLYAYAYRYDGRGLCTWKKLPGCAYQQVWYDQRGLPCFSDDGNLRAAGPTRFTLYDAKARPVVSGVGDVSMPTNIHQMTILAAMTGSGTFGGYSLPLSVSGIVQLTVTYYDDYSFLDALPQDVADSIAFRPSSLSAYQAPASGRVTGGRTYVMGGDSLYEASAVYYDRRGRTVQENCAGGLRGTWRRQTAYTFTGKPRETLTVRSAPGKAPVTERYTYTYDQRTDRPLAVTHSVNGSAPVTLAAYTYDVLGRTATKAVGGIETVSYARPLVAHEDAGAAVHRDPGLRGIVVDHYPRHAPVFRQGQCHALDRLALPLISGLPVHLRRHGAAHGRELQDGDLPVLQPAHL